MQDYFFGDWLKEQRKNFNLTQKELSDKTNNQISQSLISTWENKEIEIPSLNNILIILKALEINFNAVPFNHFKLEKNKSSTLANGSDTLSKRFSLYDLPNEAESVKTFCGKTYKVKGFLGVETTTGELKHITDLYYDVRSIVDDEKRLTAKRKNKEDELVRVKKKRKIKEK